MTQRLLQLLVFALLLALPFLYRYVRYEAGTSTYTSPEIRRVDFAALPTYEPPYQPIIDEPIQGEGHIVFDLSRNNNLAINDLTPLQDRLAARGISTEEFTGESGSLKSALRGASGLVVAAPSLPYHPDEQALIKEFVADGGRLLLTADPTRAMLSFEEETEEPFPDIFAAFFQPSAVPAINTLASAFDIVYINDYLYNVVENEGNYRNIRFTDIDNTHPLMDEIETLVFFASHSLHGEGNPLVIGDKNTHSFLRRGEEILTAALLSTDERVLALGDLSLLTSPYHTIADNDRFLSHLATWLAVDQRQRSLEDFPYLFGQPVDVVPTANGQLDPRLISRMGRLEEIFAEASLPVTLRDKPSPNSDVLYVGTFDETNPIEEHLIHAGVTLSVTFDMPDNPLEAPTTGDFLTDTILLTDTVAIIEEERIPEENTTSNPILRGTVTIEGMGTVDLQGTALFIIDQTDDHTVVLSLAENIESALNGIEQLSAGDFYSCSIGTQVTVCTTEGFAPPIEEQPEEELPLPPPPTTGDGGIFLLAKDNGTQGARTSVAELEAILSPSYRVTTWSIKEQGIPTTDDVAGFDLYIVDSGDFAAEPDDFEIFSALAEVEGGLMFIGSQAVQVFENEPAPLDALEVSTSEHPLTLGFTEGQIIPLSASESGVPAIVFTTPTEEDSLTVPETLLKRGPSSIAAGTPSMLAIEDETLNARTIFAAFAFYRLPEDAQTTLAINMVEWLMAK